MPPRFTMSSLLTFMRAFSGATGRTPVPQVNNGVNETTRACLCEMSVRRPALCARYAADASAGRSTHASPVCVVHARQ